MQGWRKLGGTGLDGFSLSAWEKTKCRKDLAPILEKGNGDEKQMRCFPSVQKVYKKCYIDV